MKNKFGDGWINEKFDENMTWGEVTLTPSRIYHSAVLEMIGRYKEERKVEIKGIAHITGGGLPGNIPRILKNKNLGADLNNLPKPHKAMLRLQEMGEVSDEEAYKTWNMGVGMVLVSNEFEKIKEIADKYGIKAQAIGEVSDISGIRL